MRALPARIFAPSSPKPRDVPASSGTLAWLAIVFVIAVLGPFAYAVAFVH
jgi:hypothetical protein